MKIQIIIVMIVPLIATKLLNMTTNEEISLAKALITIILKFYVAQSNTISVTNGGSSRLYRSFDAILTHVCAVIDEKLGIAFQITSPRIYEYDTRSSSQFRNNIIVVDTYKSFRFTYQSMIAASFDYSGYYTIVLTEINGTDIGIVGNILRDCWERYITNVNILIPQITESSEATLFTYFPFTPFRCENVEPVIWNHFHDGHLMSTDKELFPHKLKNLFQCPLTVVTVEIQPYIFIGNIQSNNTFAVEGIDASLMYVLSERMNFKPMFVVPDDIPRRGVIYKDGTVTGAFGMVHRKKANISIAAILYTSHRDSVLTASAPYMYEELVFVVPNPIPYSSLKILLIPFTLSTWITIVTIFALAVIAILIVKRSHTAYGIVVDLESHSPYMNLIYVFLVGATLKEPRRNFARFLVIVWIIACLVLRTAYQGELYTFMKMNKMKDSVRSIEELIERNISVKLPEELLAFVTFDHRMEKQLRFYDPNSYWHYVTETEAYVYPLSPLVYNVTWMMSKKRLYTKVKTLRIGVYPFVMYLSKNSCLTSEINKNIQNVVASGFFEKWTSEYKETRFLSSDRLDKKIPHTLNTTQLIGIFQLYGLLLIGASISFFLEILLSLTKL